ncbi:glycoside hydrolase family 10 protein [Paenibacillus arenilitoris]|uniref:Family 10 glycosylhydrolase n=1 Tax=Paenibacillus arenilitoris TaxID=2772299 RepID=A0A927CRA2_9BACL|nr:family 10 glycosylhydrolase [Paenibacillus arenilitoris]MBD2870190.1 family 10 glycosylhydrolase [Paenibacillus arenilitoris]
MKIKPIWNLALCFSLLLLCAAEAAYSEPSPASADPPAVTLEDGTAHVIDLIDEGREDGKLSLFTVRSGKQTPPPSLPSRDAIVAGGIVAAKYEGSEFGTYIPPDGYVLSGTGAAAAIVDALRVGDSVTANFPIPALPDRYFSIGGAVVPITQINAGRGPADIVLYLPSYGSATRTNPWGMELTVENGTVTRIVAIAQDAGGNWLDNNSPIPPGGYVLSIQADSPHYGQLNGTVREGDPIDLHTDNESLIQAYKTGYDALNPKTREDNPGGWDDGSNAPFPGHRGADQLIVYDGSYGSSTGTNPWGYEVTVNADGKVTRIGGNDSPIPAGGYVISGHGVQADWLSEHVAVGSAFKLLAEKKQALFLFTPESYLDKGRIGIDAAGQALLDAKRQFLDVDYAGIERELAQAEEGLGALSERIRQGNFERFAEDFAKLAEGVDRAGFMTYESRAVDHRSIWIRPKETSRAQVKEHIAKLAAMHINSIYLETWWNGYTIFPTSNPLAAQNPMYGGFDVLQAYIDEAGNAGIEVHAWVENFFVGVTGMTGPVKGLKPEWSMISRKGDDFQDVPLYSTRYYFLNPVLPEVRDFVAGIYRELLQNYDVDGLHLDYIRYPDAGDYTNDFGFDPYTRDLFKQEHGVDPIELHPGDELWSAWSDLKKNTINEFVYRVSGEAKAIKPGIKVSAAVWPNYERGPEYMSQEPKDWAAKNKIDQLFPMSYHLDAVSVAADAASSVALVGGKSLVVIGVGTNLGLTKEMLLDQIKQSVDRGVSGSALFEFESLFNNGYDSALLAGIYSKKAIVPDRDPLLSVRTIAGEMRRKIEQIYIPMGGIKGGKTYVKELEKLEKGWKDNKSAAKEAAKSIKDIAKLTEGIAGDRYVNEEVKKRMAADLAQLRRIVAVYLSKAAK